MKILLINRCTDSAMWYAGKVGQTVDYIDGPDDDGFYTSMADDGYMNIVLRTDCTLLEVIDGEGLKR